MKTTLTVSKITHSFDGLVEDGKPVTTTGYAFNAQSGDFHLNSPSLWHYGEPRFKMGQKITFEITAIEG